MPTFLPKRAPAWTTAAAATKSGAALSILLATSSTQGLKGSGSSSSSNSSLVELLDRREPDLQGVRFLGPGIAGVHRRRRRHHLEEFLGSMTGVQPVGEITLLG